MVDFQRKDTKEKFKYKKVNEGDDLAGQDEIDIVNEIIDAPQEIRPKLSGK